jgi:autotransporter-associated beta strand protein
VTFNVVGSGNTENLGAIRLEGSSVIGATSSVVLGGNTVLGSNVGTGTINAAITQSTTSALTKVGAGILALGGANTYTGATTVSAGTLSITGNSTGLTGGFVVNASGGNTASTLLLNGNTGSLASNAAIKLNGGIFNYQNTTVGSTFDASGYSFRGSDRTYQSTYGTSGNAVLNLASATRTAGTVNNYTTTGGSNGTTNKITFTSAPTTDALVDKGDYFGGTSYLAYDSTNSAARAYNYSTDANGATSIGGTTLGSVTGKNVDLTTAAVTAQTTDSINTLRLGTTNGVAITAANTLSVDGILKSGGNAATISGGSIQAVSSGGEMVLRSNASGDTLTITSVIADNGTSSLTTSGLGTIALNAANTYAGGTQIGAGIVTFNNNTSFGTGTITSNGGGVIRGAATTTNNLVVNGTTILDVSGGNWNLNGNISGSGDITRGTNANLSLYLGGDNSGYTGTFTTVNNGNAVVRFNNANSGSANAKWAFNNTNAGKTTLSWAGTGTISFGSMTGNGDVRTDVAGAKTISVGALNLNDTFSGTIVNGTGTIALTKVGNGTMTLSGNNTYTGATTISAGTLALGAANRIADTSAMVLGGGTFATGGFSETVGTLTINTTSVIDFGSGTSALAFANSSAITWNGTLTLSNFDVGTDTLRFGTDATGLTGAQLSAISLTGYTATGLDATGFVTFTAVPEPHEFALAIVALLGVMIFIRRRNQQV